MFYLGQVDPAFQIHLDQLVYRIRDTFINALYHHAVKQAIENKVLAYSHRMVGWQTKKFQLDEDFSIQVNTNFGYGNSSYFELTIMYRDIHLTPFSNLILYPFANLERLIRSTRSYEVSYESFVPCYAFVCEVYNKFQESKGGFILTHIVNELNKLVEGLEYYILATEVDYYDFKSSFLNRIHSRFERKKFAGVEVNHFRTSKAIQAITIVPSIQKINTIITVTPYLDRINDYVHEVLKQNHVIFNQLENSILSMWHNINDLYEHELSRLVTGMKKTLVVIKKYDLYRKPDRLIEFSVSVEVDLIFRAFRFLHPRYFKLYQYMILPLVDPTFVLTFGDWQLDMTTILNAFPEIQTYQTQVSDWISRYLQQLSPDQRSGQATLIQEFEKHLEILVDLSTSTWPILMMTIAKLNLILRKQCEPLLTQDLRILLSKMDVLLESFKHYEMIIGSAFYFPVLQRQTQQATTTSFHRLLSLDDWPPHLYIKKSLDPQELNYIVKKLLLSHLKEGATAYQELAAELNQVLTMIQYSESFHFQWKTFLEVLDDTKQLAFLTKKLITKQANLEPANAKGVNL